VSNKVEATFAGVNPDELREVAQSNDGHVRVVRVFFNPNHKVGLQVYKKGRKFGPLLLLSGGQTMDDLIELLLEVAP
jgi:hypothetical protein